MRILLVLLLAAATAAGAGVFRVRSYDASVSAGACPTGTPGLESDSAEKGFNLSEVRGWKLRVCPASGQTFSGGGKLLSCLYDRVQGSWSALPPVEHVTMWNMPSTASTSSNPCVDFLQVESVVGKNDLLYVYSDPSTPVAVSGGTTFKVYVLGETR